MNRKVYALTLIIQAICWSLVFWLLIANANPVVQAKPLFQTIPASTPVPFLGPIYYDRQDVWNIFDHDLPWASIVDDGNDDVLHHDGTMYFAVTITPVPGATPTPTGWPTPASYVPDPGYGYDQHGGIDYSLVYEPVLAAADGDVIVADWSDPSNHRKGYGLHVQLDHGTYTTIYGHLSTLVVEYGDIININPGDPGNRNHIIGISGNTGAVFGANGPCDDVAADPLCGVHLHFEVREGSSYQYGRADNDSNDCFPN